MQNQAAHGKNVTTSFPGPFPWLGDGNEVEVVSVPAAHTFQRFTEYYIISPPHSIDRFRYIKIQPETIDLSTRLWRITTEFVGFIPKSLVLRSIFEG